MCVFFFIFPYVYLLFQYKILLVMQSDCHQTHTARCIEEHFIHVTVRLPVFIYIHQFQWYPYNSRVAQTSIYHRSTRNIYYSLSRPFAAVGAVFDLRFFNRWRINTARARIIPSYPSPRFIYFNHFSRPQRAVYGPYPTGIVGVHTHTHLSGF